MRKTWCKVFAIISAFTSVGYTQSLSPDAAMRLFRLRSEFEEPVTLQAKNGDNAFPWQIIDENGTLLGMVESIVIDSKTIRKYYILDAQLVDGNDLKLAVPLE